MRLYRRVILYLEYRTGTRVFFPSSELAPHASSPLSLADEGGANSDDWRGRLEGEEAWHSVYMWTILLKIRKIDSSGTLIVSPRADLMVINS